MDASFKSEKTPSTIQEAILNYLREQNLFTVDEFNPYGDLKIFTGQEIRDAEQAVGEDDRIRINLHNQRHLFDMKDILPDFDIDDDVYDQLTFRESLIISVRDEENSATLIPIGGLCLDVQKATGEKPPKPSGVDVEKCMRTIFGANNEEGESKSSHEILTSCGDNENKVAQEVITPKFLVHVSSQFNVDDAGAGSTITSWVDRKLHTLEELRKEFVAGDIDGTKVSNEKKLYVGMMKGFYYVNHNSTMENTEERMVYSLRKARDYVSEGANFILMRFLACTIYIGTFELSCMYINGDMCRNIYECTGPESDTVNNKKLDLCRIQRTIVEECGLVHKCVTILTLQGQIIKQEWENSKYVLQVNPFVVVKNEKPPANEQLLLKNMWEKDMQLFSKYLDKKAKCLMKVKSYMYDHPEFKQMIRDYVNAILLMKPEDVLEFTIQHFLAFTPNLLPENEFFYYD